MIWEQGLFAYDRFPNQVDDRPVIFALLQVRFKHS
jgi:hypothetical protein